MTPERWRKISRLYHEVLVRETSDRSAFLDDACAGDPDLRHELDSLLQDNERNDTRGLVGDKTASGWSFSDMALRSSGRLESGDFRLADVVDAMLSKSHPFARLGEETVQGLLGMMSLSEYDAGEYLIRQGDPGEYLLLILSGTAYARVRGSPADSLPVGEFGTGDVVGEISLITDEPRTADVVARTAIRALLLSATDFRTIADQRPEVRVWLTNIVADRLGQAAYDGLGGKEIHGYRIVRCVGRGGMGIVYEATQVRSDEKVALKMMNHRFLYQPDALERFRREAAALKALNHPGIARLIECFHAYKTEFLAMEFCEGSTLDELIAARGRLDERSVKRLIGQLAIALKYIHSLGLVHRDLKPSNVMVSPSGAIKLLDFGLVKWEQNWLGASELSNSQRTLSTRVIGTPRYMAPEQFSGAATDRRTDFYSLACVAYEALSGRPLIGASDVFGIIREQLQFALPGRHDIGSGVSPDLYDFLCCGLDHRLERRTIDLDRLETWATL